MGKTHIIHPQKRKKRRRRKGSGAFSWESSGSASRGKKGKRFKWMAFTALLVALPGLLILGFRLNSSPRLGKIPTTMEKIAKKEAETISLPNQPLDPSVKSEQALAALLAFVNAPDNSMRCDHVIGRRTIRNILEGFYKKRERTLPARVINPTVAAVEVGGREIVIVSFVDENGKSKAAPFEWDVDGYRLHWEAFVGYGEISWQEFFDQKPMGEFKMRANLYLPENSGSEDLTVLLSHPELSSPKVVRILKGSLAARMLSSYPFVTDIPVLIGIRWPEKDDLSLPVVTRWFHRDWIDP